MRTIPASEIFKGACALHGQPWSHRAGEDSLSLTDFRMVRNILADRLNSAWHSFPWPQLVMIEERRRVQQRFYFAISYVAGAQVLDDVSNQCFVAVTLVPDNVPPPTESPQLWALLGDIPFQVTNEPFQKFNIGDRVLNQNDGKVYYCFKNGSYFIDTGLASSFYPLPDFDPAFPLDDGWQQPMEECLGVFSLPPSGRDNAPLSFALVDSAVRVEGDPGSAWFRYRRQCPVLRGDPWDEEAVYGPGDQVYFVYPDYAGTGDFYDCLSATKAGESPATSPTLWRKVELPYIFSSYLQWAIHGDWYELDGQQEKAGATAIKAFERLQLEYDKIERQQRQEEPWTVTTR